VRRQRFYDRHGISQNPTEGERRLLRTLWCADDARNRAHHAASGGATAETPIRESEPDPASIRALIAPTQDIPIVSDETHV
jgi:hypothetical protein